MNRASTPLRTTAIAAATAVIVGLAGCGGAAIVDSQGPQGQGAGAQAQQQGQQAQLPARGAAPQGYSQQGYGQQGSQGNYQGAPAPVQSGAS